MLLPAQCLNYLSLFSLFFLQKMSGFFGGVGTSFGIVLFNSLIIPSVAIIGVLSKSKKLSVDVSKNYNKRWLLVVVG